MLLVKGTPLEGGAGADPKCFEKAVKEADKLGERIAKTTDKIMEMRKDIDGKQVATILPLLLPCDSQLFEKQDATCCYKSAHHLRCWWVGAEHKKEGDQRGSVSS